MFAYVGGKYRQSKWISSFFPKRIKKYVEVFGGAMWVYINGKIESEKVFYNDFNPFMANVFSCCVHHQEFLKYLNRVKPQDVSIFNEYKKEVLKINKTGKDISFPDFDLAAKYMYLVTQTFSGIMSEKAKMILLDPNKYKSTKYDSFKNKLNKPAIQSKLEKLEVFNLSYEKIIPILDEKETYFYLDPPYYGTENLYAFHNFNIDDHKKLADILNNCKGKWVLSYYDFKESNEWYPIDKFRREFKDYKKASMAKKGKKQSQAIEMLIIKE